VRLASLCANASSLSSALPPTATHADGTSKPTDKVVPDRRLADIATAAYNVSARFAACASGLVPPVRGRFAVCLLPAHSLSYASDFAFARAFLLQHPDDAARVGGIETDQGAFVLRALYSAIPQLLELSVANSSLFLSSDMRSVSQ
jgi:hypothetical protein